MRIKKNIRGFSKFNENLIYLEAIFEILIIHKPSLGSHGVTQKIWADRFSRFDIYWIQTDKHPDKQSIFIDR